YRAPARSRSRGLISLTRRAGMVSRCKCAARRRTLRATLWSGWAMQRFRTELGTRLDAIYSLAQKCRMDLEYRFTFTINACVESCNGAPVSPDRIADRSVPGRTANVRGVPD